MSKQCLTESFIFKPLLVESDESGKVVARGQFGKADVPTANGRVYPRKLFERELSSLTEKMKDNQVYGELDHPGDGTTKLQRVSHLVTNAHMLPDGRVMGEAVVLPDTRNGKQLLAILKNGGKVGISSRGFGSVQTNEQGHDVVQDDFQLMTWDFVADPAAGGSFPEFTNESTKNKVEVKLVEASKNTSWGFFGTLKDNYQLKDSEAKKVFAHAEKTLGKVKGTEGGMATDFLDSKLGRHLADDLSFHAKLGGEPTADDIIKAFEIALKKGWLLKEYKRFMKDYNPEDFNEDIDMGKKIREGKLTTESYKSKKEDEELDKKDMPEEDEEVKELDEEESEDQEEEEEPEDKMEALVAKIRKEESEKATSKLSEMIDGMKESIREEIKSELESDPKIAGAKLAIESVKQQLRPYIIGEDISEEIGKRDTQIESLQKESKAKDAQLQEYAKVTKELGYKLRVEQKIADYSNKIEIRQRIGDVTRFESLKQLDKKLDEVLTVVKEQKRRVENQLRQREEEIKRLKESSRIAEEKYKKALKVSEDFASQAYLEKKIAGHPNAAKIRSIAERRKVKTSEGIDSLVEQFNSFRSPGKSMRTKIQNRFSSKRSETLVEDQIEKTRPKHRDVEIAPGVSMSDVKRLS